ncbi:MAG: hypothetical protein JWL60_2245 [Gemmatimonadetes bacterium]|jgi:NadR type nicotinamide-nucleotide adenylyltransferase|nr:hypothetical protein [Gemmatimonadota bacterium]
MEQPPLVRLCVTGPESTGKTTLALQLAAWLGTVCVPEASRLYAEERGGTLAAEDVEPIARRQLQLDDDASRRARALGARHLVLDTDLVSTLVYADHYYGLCPPSVVEAERSRRAALYLLCDIDVPWVADGVRDRPGHRGELLQLFADALARRGARTVPVTGDEDTRFAIARTAVAALSSP